MEKAVSSRKFKTTIISMCLGFLMVVGAVIGVWAASTQNLSAGFKINYSVGDNVSADVRTEYYIPGKNEGAVVTTNEAGQTVTDSNGYVTFSPSEKDTTEKGVFIGNFELGPTTPEIIFYITVRNNHGEDYLQVLVGKEIEKTNMSVTTTYYNCDEDSFAASRFASSIASSQYQPSSALNAEPKGWKLIRISLKVENLNAAASCSGDIVLSLNSSDEEQSVSTLSKTAFRDYFYYDTTEGYNIPGVTVGNLIFDYAQFNTSLSKTGTDVSEARDGSIWIVQSAGNTYVLSEKTIQLPEDSSQLFASNRWEDDMDASFYYGYFLSLKDYKFNNIDTSNVINMSKMFSTELGYLDSSTSTLDLSMFDTSKVTDMSYMFYNRWDINELDMSSFDTSKVTDMSYMFSECWGLTNLNVSMFNTSQVTNMESMFYGLNCKSLDLSSFDTSNVTDMGSMFARSSIQILDLSSFNTSKVRSMYAMFGSCYSLKTIYVSDSWSTQNVSGSEYMFDSCRSLVGAVAWSSSNTEKSMANYTTGYLTYKAK